MDATSGVVKMTRSNNSLRVYRHPDKFAGTVYSYAGNNAPWYDFGTRSDGVDLLSLTWDLTNASERMVTTFDLYVEGWGDGKNGPKKSVYSYEYAPAPGKGAKAEIEYVFFALNSGRQPTPKERKSEDASGNFKLIHCEWSITGERTPPPPAPYNCFAWAGGQTTVWVQDTVYEKQNIGVPGPQPALGPGMWQEFTYVPSRRLLLVYYATAPNKGEEKVGTNATTAEIVLYEGAIKWDARWFRQGATETGPLPSPPYDTGLTGLGHAARSTHSTLQVGISNVGLIYESKLGSSYRIEHLLNQIEGPLYGKAKVFLAKK